LTNGAGCPPAKPVEPVASNDLTCCEASGCLTNSSAILALVYPLSVGALIVVFSDSLSSAVFSATTSQDKIFSPAVIVQFSPMTTFLPLVASACSGRISTLEFCKSMVLTRKGLLSTCIFLRLNRPSLMADWTCRRKTLQSLVA
jgi:hypothetical protein